MKKLLLILILAMTIMASSCNKKTDTEVPKDPQVVEEKNEEVKEEKPDNKEEEVETLYKNYPKGEIIEEQVVYDQDNIKIKAKSVFYEDTILTISFEVENNTEEQKDFVLDYLLINGYEVGLFNEITVFPNKKGILTDSISLNVLETIKSKEVVDLKVSVGVKDENYNNNEIALVDVKTKFSDKEYTPPHKSGKVLYKDGKFELIGLGIMKQSDSVFYTIVFKNNSENDISIGIENHTINGFNVYGFAFGNVHKGNTTIMNINLQTEVLELLVDKDFQGKLIDAYKNIDEIKEILFTMRLSDMVSYEEILKETLKMELE